LIENPANNFRADKVAPTPPLPEWCPLCQTGSTSTPLAFGVVTLHPSCFCVASVEAKSLSNSSASWDATLLCQVSQ
ncbi:hypothetical protein P7K49_012780, partial [Saguinus oedipus]